MSFPLTGKAADVAHWLRSEDFKEATIQSFTKWTAGAMLGVTETDLKMKVTGDEGIRLWSLLNTARNLQGEFR